MGRSIDLEALYAGLVFSLPMFEGSGAATVRDVSKAHHPVTQVHAPAWTQLPSGIWCMDFDGANDYLRCLNASSVDLDFAGSTSTFSGCIWVYLDGGCYLISRHVLNTSGWSLHATASQVVLSRHGAGTYGYVRSDSIGVTGSWYLFGWVKDGTAVAIYRNGIDVTFTSSGWSSNILTSAGDLTVGLRSDVANYLNGQAWHPRIWNRALAPAEHREIFNRERALFNV